MTAIPPNRNEHRDAEDAPVSKPVRPEQMTENLGGDMVNDTTNEHEITDENRLFGRSAAVVNVAQAIDSGIGVRSTMIQVNETLQKRIDPSLISALQQGPRDRTFLLRIEKQLIGYIMHQPTQDQIRLPTPFPPYQRMLVHRLADYFGFARIVEKKGHPQEANITLIKTPESRVPDKSLLMVCEEMNLLTAEERRPNVDFKPSIQQRAYPSADRGQQQDNDQFVEPRRELAGTIDDTLLTALCNAKERKFLLKLEKEVIRQIQLPTCKNIKLTTPFMPYHRMLVHRMADCYGLARVVERKGQTSLITLIKLETTSIPARTLSMAAEDQTTCAEEREEEQEDEEEKVVFAQAPMIMKREASPVDLKESTANVEIVTYEEKERQYAEARKRIFGSEEEFDDKPEVAPKGKAKSAAKVKATVGANWQDHYDPAYDRSHPQYPPKQPSDAKPERTPDRTSPGRRGVSPHQTGTQPRTPPESPGQQLQWPRDQRANLGEPLQCHDSEVTQYQRMGMEAPMYTVPVAYEWPESLSQGDFSGFQPAGTPYDREHQPGQPSVPVMVGMQEQYIPGMGAPIPVFHPQNSHPSHIQVVPYPPKNQSMQYREQQYQQHSMEGSMQYDAHGYPIEMSQYPTEQQQHYPDGYVDQRGNYHY